MGLEIPNVAQIWSMLSPRSLRRRLAVTHTRIVGAVFGQRLPSLAERLRDAATPWQSLRVRWYDGRVRRLQVSSGTALWYRSGQPVLPLRWVLVRPCDAQCPPRAFFSTCPSDPGRRCRGVFHQALEH